MKRLRTIAVCLVLVGCNSTFKDEDDELEYLSTITQPTVAQFHRKRELEAAVVRKLSEQGKSRRKTESIIDKKNREEAAAKLLREAKDTEDIFNVHGERAMQEYRKVFNDYPGTEAARLARERFEVIWADGNKNP